MKLSFRIIFLNLSKEQYADFITKLESMLELVRKYHVDGIHFDYIRYPDLSGCYCPRCREKFEARIGRKVEQWPAEVIAGKDPQLEKAIEIVLSGLAKHPPVVPQRPKYPIRVK